MRACERCPRLVAYRSSISPKKGFEGYRYHNAPVEPFGDQAAWLLIVGMAPGAHGANRTSRPFTGDGAGEILYPALVAAGLANKHYTGEFDENFRLNGVLITNVVRCVPPANKPLPSEFTACRPYLRDTLEMPSVTDILCIGRDAWEHLHKALGEPAEPFRHFGMGRVGKRRIWAIYHTSRYNQNTGRISQKDVETVLENIAREGGRR